jgi:hypothetical protein
MLVSRALLFFISDQIHQKVIDCGIELDTAETLRDLTAEEGMLVWYNIVRVDSAISFCGYTSSVLLQPLVFCISM